MKLAPNVRGKLTRVVPRQSDLNGPYISDDGSTIAYSKSDASEKGVYLHADGIAKKIGDGKPQRISLSEDGQAAAWMEHGVGQTEIKRWKNGKTQVVDRSRSFDSPVQISDDGEFLVWTDSMNDELETRTSVKCWKDGKLTEHPGGQDSILAGQSKDAWFVRSDSEGWRWEHTNADETLKPEPLALDHQHLAVDDLGNKFVFNDRKPGRRQTNNVFLYDRESRETVPISRDPNLHEIYPTISGDGTTVAFTMRKGEYDDVEESNIWIHRDGRLHQITTGNLYEGQNWHPRLSEDGTVLTWRNTDHWDEIYRLDLNWDEMTKG